MPCADDLFQETSSNNLDMSLIKIQRTKKYVGFMKEKVAGGNSTKETMRPLKKLSIQALKNFNYFFVAICMPLTSKTKFNTELMVPVVSGPLKGIVHLQLLMSKESRVLNDCKEEGNKISTKLRIVIKNTSINKLRLCQNV